MPKLWPCSEGTANEVGHMARNSRVETRYGMDRGQMEEVFTQGFGKV